MVKIFKKMAKILKKLSIVSIHNRYVMCVPGMLQIGFQEAIRKEDFQKARSETSKDARILAIRDEIHPWSVRQQTAQSLADPLKQGGVIERLSTYAFLTEHNRIVRQICSTNSSGYFRFPKKSLHKMAFL